MSYVPILCLDFDGVIHSYTSGWKGADIISDPPVPGAALFIAIAVRSFEVHIFSSRSGQEGGVEAMKEYVGFILAEELPRREAAETFDAIKWPTEKPPATISIDDRAIQFTGEWPEIDALINFKPWNKQ